MPYRLLDLLFRFLRQNGGTLSKRVREREFAGLTDRDAAEIKGIFEGQTLLPIPQTRSRVAASSTNPGADQLMDG